MNWIEDQVAKAVAIVSRHRRNVVLKPTPGAFLASEVGWYTCSCDYHEARFDELSWDAHVARDLIREIGRDWNTTWAHQLADIDQLVDNVLEGMPPMKVVTIRDMAEFIRAILEDYQSKAIDL